MPSKRIYMSVPHMSGREESYVAEAFRSNWLSSVGPHIDGFEREVANRLGGVHTVAVSSGTAALHLVLRYIGVGTRRSRCRTVGDVRRIRLPDSVPGRRAGVHRQ